MYPSQHDGSHIAIESVYIEQYYSICMLELTILFGIRLEFVSFIAMKKTSHTQQCLINHIPNLCSLRKGGSKTRVSSNFLTKVASCNSSVQPPQQPFHSQTSQHSACRVNFLQLFFQML
mmetsp:Transcript_8250/g.17852  ORF Transcript_8250/g.17852 Transcript_8250/m.17852 type:complete len:119 (+) Transcript_8250:1441-1797(+)